MAQSKDLAEASGTIEAGLVTRLLSGRVAILLARNTVVSCAVFVFGIALLWVLVQLLGIPKIPAVTLSFIAANSIHYAFSRVWIFASTDRAPAAGYALFLINAGVALAITIALFWLFTDLFGMHYLVARAVASLFAGLGAFLLNATLNFRSV